MTKLENPFIHDAATNLSEDVIAALYIDVDKSEIIMSQRNVFIEGYRGSGKSMLLKHNSFSMRYSREEKLDFIGVYISCMSPYFLKREHELNENSFHSSIVAEHILVLSMAQNLLNTLLQSSFLDTAEDEAISKELEFYFDIKISSISELAKHINKELYKTQEHLNKHPEDFYSKARTFSSLILPIADSIKSIDRLQATRISFLIDDGQLLSTSQKKCLNSWISYRDTSKINFKVAITSKKEYLFHTNTESVILENHDYVTIDLEKNFFGEGTDYYDFAKKIIEKRLEFCDTETKKAEDFFPQDEKFTKDIEKIRSAFIDGEYPELKDKTKEERKSRASKFDRAIYFRLRLETHKANNPTIAYTGFDSLVNISTGVIRNLLIPCSTMYSNEKENSTGGIVNYIQPKTQYSAIIEESKKKWEYIKLLGIQIDGCDDDLALQIERLLRSFGNKLKAILLDTSSTEKQILTFTIEGLENSQYNNQIKQILDIAEKAGLLYSRIGAGKNSNRTVWYTPNRILWAELGLDPVGQNGRLNIKPEVFLKMASEELTKEFFMKKEQEGLFDEIW